MIFVTNSSSTAVDITISAIVYRPGFVPKIDGDAGFNGTVFNKSHVCGTMTKSVYSMG